MTLLKLRLRKIQTKNKTSLTENQNKDNNLDKNMTYLDKKMIISTRR